MGEYARFFEDVAGIPVVDVISSRIPLKRRGTYYDGLCPFHGDKSLGSFKVNAAKNTWRCYACGEGGGAAAFVAKFDGTSLFEASVKLGVEYGLVSQDEGEKMLRGKGTGYKPKKKRVIVPVSPNTPRDASHLERVYDAFAAAAGPLSDEQLAHIRGVRHADGWESEFFRWPNPKNPQFWVRFGRELKSRGIMEPVVSAVRCVPGFAFNLETMRPYFMTGVGIGIRLHDADGHTTGLQLRSDNKSDKVRYRLFSSGWAEMNSDDALYAFDGATMPQALDVISPKVGKPVRAAITEGRFKGIQLAKRGYLVLSLNGVNNYQLILGQFVDCLNRAGISEVDIYFDSDMFTKQSVARAAIGIFRALHSSGLSSYFVTWDPSLGKGIDDVLIAGHHSSLRRSRGDLMEKRLRAQIEGRSE